MDLRALNTGDTVHYDDGRPGHSVDGIVLHNSDRAVVVHFSDRAEPNVILHTDAAWTKHLTIADKNK